MNVEVIATLIDFASESDEVEFAAQRASAAELDFAAALLESMIERAEGRLVHVNERLDTLAIAAEHRCD
jgi:hypothetical protein